MLNKIYLWIGKKSLSLFVCALVITCLVTIYQLIDITRKPLTLKNFGDAAFSLTAFAEAEVKAFKEICKC